MSRRFLVAALLALLVSGCASPGADPDPDPADDGDEPRRSVGGGGENGTEDAPHVDVPLASEPVQIVGMGEATFDVAVPANITNVDFRFVYKTSHHQDQLQVTLAGCGTYAMTGIAGTTNPNGGATVWHRICDDASEGTHQLKVSNGPAGFIDATIEVMGQRPLGNATAP